ncbi:MAG: hypothetical protein JO314_02250 [Acidobacteria bacterium]|nr:hypothetical protein [Acidobacteriota bacterium]
MKIKRNSANLISFALLIMVCASAFAYADVVKRNAGESAEDFAKRNAPAQTAVSGKVVESPWNGKKTIFAFYETQPKDPNDTVLEGFVFVPADADSYERIHMHTFGVDGGTPQIESVFFANADKDPASELVVIVCWPQVHYDYSGNWYGTVILDDIPAGTHPTELKYLEKVSEKVSGGCDCEFRDGRKPDKRFENAAQVKAGLKRLGY